MLEITSYAPVYIPTLNRYEHFKQCLESLENCIGADKTDVYVGLDYPPTEKYVDGWRRIDSFLTEKEKVNGFKNLFVRRRDYNCGVGREGSNAQLLKEEVRLSGYSRYIYAEDDNIFSYRFLEYINRGFMEYENDTSVFAICGYSHPYVFKSKETASVVLMPEFSAWGVGRWFDRLDQADALSPEKILTSKEVRSYFRKNRPEIYGALLWMVKNKRRLGDSFYTAYLHYTNRNCLFPLTTLVENKGWDGTGTHGGVVNAYLDQVGEPEIHEEFTLRRLSPQEEKRYHQTYLAYWNRYEGIIKRLCYQLMFCLYEWFGVIITTDDFKRVKNLFKS